MKVSTLLVTAACFGSLTIGYWLGRGQHVRISATTLAPQAETVPLGEPAQAIGATTEAPTERAGLELSQALLVQDELSADQLSTQLMSAFALPLADPARTRSIGSLLEQLAQTDPLQALEIADQIESLRAREDAKISILEIWASNDPVAALTWANSPLKDLPSRLRAAQVSAIYRGFAKLNAAAAFQSALQLDERTVQASNLKRLALSEVVEIQIRKGDLFIAKLAIEQLSNNEIKNDLIHTMIGEWARFDPENAAGYVHSLGENAPTKLKHALISEWAKIDPLQQLTGSAPSPKVILHSAAPVQTSFVNGPHTTSGHPQNG